MFNFFGSFLILISLGFPVNAADMSASKSEYSTCHYCRANMQRTNTFHKPKTCSNCNRWYCGRFECDGSNSIYWVNNICGFCLDECCCNYSDCRLNHGGNQNHCFTYRRTQGRHAAKLHKWTKPKKGIRYQRVQNPEIAVNSGPNYYTQCNNNFFDFNVSNNYYQNINPVFVYFSPRNSSNYSLRKQAQFTNDFMYVEDCPSHIDARSSYVLLTDLDLDEIIPISEATNLPENMNIETYSPCLPEQVNLFTNPENPSIQNALIIEGMELEEFVKLEEIRLNNILDQNRIIKQ